jgi:predicted aldo/keto reductase-like oxidoreductase
MGISRRVFLKVVGAGSLVKPVFGASAKLPRRALGKTGVEVSCLAFGAGSRFLMYEEEDVALAVLNEAIDMGITYIDTAQSYGNGKSEERVGKIMRTRRSEVFLTTKLQERKGDEALRALEVSLKRLQVDQLDLVHIHALEGDEDLAQIESPDGVLKALYKARDEGMTRFIGITCHAAPATLRTALERHDFNCTQMALNAARARIDDDGFKAVKMPEGGFEEVALPVANKKGLGVIAMKVFGQEQLLGYASPEQLLRYSLSLPVSAAVAGMPKREHIRQNVEIARSFKPLSNEERAEVSDLIPREKRVALARFFANHADA